MAIARSVINFNTDWQYKQGEVSSGEKIEFDDTKWEYVNLPHTTTFYTPENKDAYLGVSWYRKYFTFDECLKGKKLSLTFEAAMQKAEVYINGEHIMTHEGGYIPFVIDISDKIDYGEKNIIAVKLDSQANPAFAPGKDQPDFQYFGGIYGNVYITVTNLIHITDAVKAGEIAGGGVFITAPEVEYDKAVVKVKTHVENESAEKEEVTLLTEILEKDGTVICLKEDIVNIKKMEAEYVTQLFEVENPRLWSPETPELYTVRSTVKAVGNVQDSLDTTYGIRKVEWKREGLYLNGKQTDVEGANLHGETYMLGNAMPDNAIYEEVKRFKENGFDFMRMAHYPHRQAYYDACDKYGVMVLECASGWQYFSNDTTFKKSTYRELRTDIRHKRNHASIVAWETSLNESRYNHEWATEMNRAAKEEYPKDGIAYAYTAGCYEWDIWDIGLSTPQAGIFGTGSEGANNPKYKDKPMIIAEYGDWTYGGSDSTTRVTREGKNDFGIEGGEKGMMIQADNVQESVENNRTFGKNWLGASMYWDYADYAGFDMGKLTCCGVVDLYRLPKHAVYFFKSQRSAKTDLSEYGIKTGPMVYIANTWEKNADTEVRIYSNCDTVELFLNGNSMGEKEHDREIWGPHGDSNHGEYPSEDSGKMIVADSMKNAPITFYLEAYEQGELKAVGKMDGKEVTEFIRRTPEEAANIRLRPESDVPVPLDGSSAKLVWIDITDQKGTVVPTAYRSIQLSIAGPGIIVGEKTITTKGGQMAVWVKSKRGSGDITLTATGEDLKSDLVVIPTRKVKGLPKVPDRGDSDEYEAVRNRIALEDALDNEEKKVHRMFSVSREKKAFASSCKEGCEPGHGSNGVPGWHWYPKSMGDEWWYIDTKGIYEIDNIQMTWNAEEIHKYIIETSTDGKKWTTVVDRSKEGTDDIRPFEPAKAIARYVRVKLPGERTSNQGFGLFDVYAPVPEKRMIIEIKQPRKQSAFAGTAFEALSLPKEAEVVLEDGIVTTLPITWYSEEYDSTKTGEITLYGRLKEIAGVSVSEECKKIRMLIEIQ